MQQLGSGSDHCFFKDRLHLQIKELSVEDLYFEVFEIKYTFFTFQLAESGQWGIGMSTLGFLWFRSHRFIIEGKDARKCRECLTLSFHQFKVIKIGLS